MKQITIIRHGDSSFVKNNDRDWFRPLSQEGKKECIELAEYLSQNKMLPEKIICSDAKRTIHTSNIILEKTGWDSKLLYLDNNLYQANLEFLYELISKQSDSIEKIMLIGHNPGISNLCSKLNNSSIYLSTSNCFTIKMENEFWDINGDIRIISKDIFTTSKTIN
ncbi:MAG: SixA phosphatase family protein [Paracoccaceae bacterium]